MTGREKIEAAFSKQGTNEIAAVMCYEGIYIRDHWKELTTSPWWHINEPDIERQMKWRKDVIEMTGHDWIRLMPFYSKEERRNILIEEKAGVIFFRDKKSGHEIKLEEPAKGGWLADSLTASVHPGQPADSEEEIDRLIPIGSPFDKNKFLKEGKADLSREILTEYGANLFPVFHVQSPLWCCYNLWGFEGMMRMTKQNPALVKHACERYLEIELNNVKMAAALGAAGIWIEECMTDMISPDSFMELNVPYLKRIVEEINKNNMKSIYYFCGDPSGKMEQMLSVGSDAISLEEGKKGFSIDIEDVVSEVKGKCVVLGNLDALGVLQSGSEDELRAEIKRQITAGRRNNNRFIMSTGSPVTPGTPVERVRMYCDMVHEMG